VDNFSPILAFPRFSNYYSAAARFVCRYLCSLFVVGLVGGAAAGADVSSAHTTSSAPGLSFSIADFDGDLKPDLADVQAGQTDVSGTNYQIQLQLSATGRQTFRIVAPMGGLRIFASDVNGDNALDLVLTTKWLRQPVAILLNDGHGKFLPVEPDAFPEAFDQSTTSWGSIRDHEIDVVCVPPQSREDICSQNTPFLHHQSYSRCAATPNSRFGIAVFLISHFGRAPPFDFSHS
jgi:hypothetical protein